MPVTVIIVIIIIIILGRVFRLDAGRKVEKMGWGAIFFFFLSFSSPTKEFLKMFYASTIGARIIFFFFFFFFWSEKNLNKIFSSSLLLINVTNKIWKLKIFVWETLFTLGENGSSFSRRMESVFYISVCKCKFLIKTGWKNFFLLEILPTLKKF